jgi:hypothetical protein
MRKFLTFLIALVLSIAGLAAALAGGQPCCLLGVWNTPISGGSYTGPGDVSVNGSTNNWYAWYSCARVYKASLASTSTSLCDLVDGAAPTVVICTLRGTPSGLVDLTAYCPGGVTPAAKCAATTGPPAGSCNISQAYDQSGNSRPVVQATAASQPFLTFSALNGLPSIQCTAATCVLATAGTYTIAQPITESGVYIMPTGGASDAPIIGQPTVATHIGGSSVSNTAVVSAGTGVSEAATWNAWHALNGLLSGSGNNCALNVDGTDTASLNCGTDGWTTTNIRVMRGNALQLIGSITEAGLLAVTSSPTDRSNICHNQKTYYATGGSC